MQPSSSPQPAILPTTEADRAHCRQSAKHLADLALLAAKSQDTVTARVSVKQLLEFFSAKLSPLELNQSVGVGGELHNKALDMLNLAKHELAAPDGRCDFSRLCAALSMVVEILPGASPPGTTLAERCGYTDIRLPARAYVIAEWDKGPCTLEIFGEFGPLPESRGLVLVRRNTREKLIERLALELPAESMLGKFSARGNLLLLSSNAGRDHEATGVWSLYFADPVRGELIPALSKLSPFPCVKMCMNAAGTRASVIEEAERTGTVCKFRLREFALSPNAAASCVGQVDRVRPNDLGKIRYNESGTLELPSAAKRVKAG